MLTTKEAQSDKAQAPSRLKSERSFLLDKNVDLTTLPNKEVQQLLNLRDDVRYVSFFNSGWDGSYSGDLAYVKSAGVTDVVITTLGYAKTAAGTDNPSRIRLNLDMYYYDQTKKKSFIVDLGEITARHCINGS